jgi:hypothetical protein
MGLWAVDCHVHFYDGYDIDSAVRSSWNNVRMPDGSKPGGQCWCLASPPGIDGLRALNEIAHNRPLATRVVASQDSQGNSFNLLESEEGTIVVVPGTQAISAEGLEVLSLGVEMPDIQPAPLFELVERVIANGGLPVVPWGVGKWLGQRGTLVSRLAQGVDTDDSLLLADNANRPWWWPFPGLLRKALADGLIVVSGSDPLPIHGDEKRIGSAGIHCTVESVDNAWEEIRHSLMNSREKSVRRYGKPMSNIRFWHNQLLLRMRSRNP